MRIGVKCHIYVPAIEKANAAGVEITPAWLIAHCGFTRRQADNALLYARRIGLVRQVERGHYVPAGAA